MQTKYDECPNQTTTGASPVRVFKSVLTDGRGAGGSAFGIFLNRKSRVIFQYEVLGACTGVSMG